MEIHIHDMDTGAVTGIRFKCDDCGRFSRKKTVAPIAPEAMNDIPLMLPAGWSQRLETVMTKHEPPCPTRPIQYRITHYCGKCALAYKG